MALSFAVKKAIGLKGEMMTTIIARSAESVHWYEKNGKPMYTVKAKDGTDRPTTLRDARKFNLVPSVTTIIKILSKPGLEQWKLEQMLLSALTLPRVEGETEKELIARISADSKETAKRAAERGTHIHESIEKWYAGVRPVDHKEIASSVEVALFEHFKLHPDTQWITERAFAATAGYGGKIDLFCNPNEYAKDGIVVDVKTKEFGPDDNITTYDEHLLQLAAYRMGLGLPYARCANVFVSVTNPGLVKIIEWNEADLDRGWKMFKCLLDFWKLKNNFGE